MSITLSITLSRVITILILILSIYLYRIAIAPQKQLHIHTIPKLSEWAKQGKYYNYNGRPVWYYDSQYATYPSSSSSSSTPSPSSPSATLLLLHGYPTSSYDWYSLLPLLNPTHRSKKWHILAIDLLGYGLSDKSLPLNSSIFTQCDMIESFIQSAAAIVDTHLPLHILAHDVSVTVVQELLARQVDRYRSQEDRIIHPKSIVLLNGGLFPEQHRAVMAQKLLLAPYSGHLIQELIPSSIMIQNINKVFGKDTKLSYDEGMLHLTLLLHNAPSGLIHTLQQYIRERRENRFRWVTALNETTTVLQPSIPIRLINGPADPISGKHMTDYYKEIIVKPDVITLHHDIGHYPQIESPLEVIKAFDEFHDRLGTFK
jgi:pimeloyl-ACP methyl ester carboxylesterase